MDCKTFRRRLLIDPLDADPELRGHTRACPACAHAAEEALAFEAKLRHALGEEAGMPRPAAPVRHRLYLLLGLLPLLAAVVWWLADPSPVTVEALALAHVHQEMALLEPDGDGLEAGPATESGDSPTPARIDQLLRGLGFGAALRLKPVRARLRYADRCRIGGQPALHLILAGERGPVTVLLLARPAPAQPRSFASERFDGLLMPLGSATLVLIGEPGEPLAPLGQRLSDPDEASLGPSLQSRV